MASTRAGFTARGRTGFAHKFGLALAVFFLLSTQVGPLAPSVMAGEPGAAEPAQDVGKREHPAGRVVEVAPAPITTPTGTGADNLSADPTIEEAPLFLPYTPPDSVEELADERTRETRTLANPDGTFTVESSNGPLNFQDSAGAWQPIDLSLVPEADGGYRVAATEATITVGTKEGALGSIALGGHTVSLSAPGYDLGAAGTGDDQNKVTFDDALSTTQVWIRPIDIGLEFGTTWADPLAAPTATFVLNPGDLLPSLDKDGVTITFTDAAGNFAGRIDRPIVRQGGADGPPMLDVTTVTIAQDLVGSYVLSYSLDPIWFTDPARVFPVILDPTWCIGAGASGCTNNTTGGALDEWFFDGDPDSYEIGWTTLRVGRDSRTDDNGSGGEYAHGKMRAILYFPPVGLPDGAVIYDTDLELDICCNYGGPVGETVTAYRLTKAFSSPYTWTRFASEYSTSTPSASDTVPSSGKMHFDVDEIVHTWYTRRAKDWKPVHGFLVRFDDESAGVGEVEFNRASNGTASNRPLLTISYTKPVIGIDSTPDSAPPMPPHRWCLGR